MVTSPTVSVLFVTYNRFPLLKRTLDTLLQVTRYANMQLVVTDDGSPPDVQRQLLQLPFHAFYLASENRGMGANINSGLKRCTGRYILMLQDDWDCIAPSDYLKNTIAVMESSSRICLINYYGVPHILATTQALPGANEPCYEILSGTTNGHNSSIYTDTPHVMSRACLESIGPYHEDREMESCETDYARRFASQDAYKAAIFPLYYNRAFVHTGEAESWRLRSFRCRLDNALMPAATVLRCCPPVFNLGKAVVRSSVRTLTRIGIIRK